MHHVKIVLSCFFILFSQVTFAIDPDDLLTPEQAFKVSAQATEDGNLLISWDIAEGYYLYRNKMLFTSKTEAITVKHADLPAGKVKSDKYFGDVVIYRHHLESKLTLQRPEKAVSFSLLVKHQGCADLGICYPPQKTLLTIQLPAINTPVSTESSANPLQQLSKSFNLGLNLFKNEAELLPAEEAFQFSAFVKEGKNLRVNWQIAKGYYLYREKIDLELLDSNNTKLLDYEIPHGTPKFDEAFGDVEILHNNVAFTIPLERLHATQHSITLRAKFQGCAERGVCYPPMDKTVTLLLPEIAATELSTPASQIKKNTRSEQDLIVQSLQQDSFFLTLLSFLGFGLLLAFTPCVFPMIPILSGIIVGQGKDISSRKAFLLSLSFVLASAMTYTVFGILAALFGSNLQATFQAPWIIYLFSGSFYPTVTVNVWFLSFRTP
ncbi:Cytochrome c-type biogenesis protein DsbD, protein-disulfide reductase [methanotrophic endosymbiont of Bathymodiolus azoricus (Menez Gwen)]|nr:Cytochrome c-type biogenesis protein DsbD, protein-disulfide reductase [methanotrophic endosymbiont of Bathymodiolus azoricus (Menez Gwen)]